MSLTLMYVHFHDSYLEHRNLGTVDHVTFQQDRQCTYKVITWRVRVMFIPPQPDAISFEKSALYGDVTNYK